LEIKVPRDRKGQFEPELIKKRQTMLDELENQIVALYAKGMLPGTFRKFSPRCMTLR